MRSYRVNIILFTAILLLFWHTSGWAQNDVKMPNTDTARTVIDSGLEQRYMNKDTVNSKFIDNMERTVKGSKLTRWLSSSIFVRDKDFTETDSTLKEDYSQYNGKTIRYVTVEGLGPYEVNDMYPEDSTRNWLTRVGEATHMDTRGFVLRNNLMVKDGDIFDNEMIINNLAYYRSLRYIYDAIAIVKPVPDSDYVDIDFIVRDVWSIGFKLNRLDLNNVNFELYDRNILGLGTELRAGLYYNRSDGSDHVGFRVMHTESNIKGSFVGSKVEIVDKKDKKMRHASLERKVLPNLKTVGGLSYEYLDEKYYFLTIDTTYRVKKETADAWLGQVYNIGAGSHSGQNRLAAMVRYEYRKLRNQMPFPDPYYDIYEDRNLYIASLSFYKQQYYTDRLLFGFGIRENIPYGYNITMQAGHENHYYGNRFYTSLSAKFGQQHRWGYTSIGGSIGGYIHGGCLKNGLLEMNLAYFSPLAPLKNQAFRQFMYISYARGIRRGMGEGNFLSYTEDLLFDLDNNNRKYYGNNKLAISLESDFYSTVRLLGFRCVFFNFLDMTWIGNKTAIFANDFLPGVGIGLRIRNDKLVFNTLQLKLGWYPKFPQSGFNDFFDSSGVDRFMSTDFIPQKPQTLEFK